MTAYRKSRLKGLLASGLCAVTVAFGWTPVSADGQLGLRLFPSTLAIDDPFVADEIGIGVVHLKTPAGAQPSPTLTTGFEARYSKRISEALGLTVGGRLLRLDPDTGGSRTGVDNPDIELKYEIVESARHEALLSAALGWEIGGVGDRDVGAASFDIVLPTVFFAKGFGDLPESLPFLRPFALSGRVGALIPTREQSRVFTSSGVGTLQRNPDVIESGLVIEYSLPYLKGVVRDIGLPALLNQVIPVVELDVFTALDRGAAGQLRGTVNPGIVWQVSPAVQVAIEAVIPMNDRTGQNVGVRAGLNIFLNRLFPGSYIGRPILGH